MKYTDELIKEVKELYPTYYEMQKNAESGNVILGRFLCDCKEDYLPLDVILKATTLQELQDKARLAKRRVDLYLKWGEEYGEAKTSFV